MRSLALVCFHVFFIIFLWLGMGINHSKASPQITDRIVIDGVEVALFEDPLSSELTTNSRLRWAIYGVSRPLSPSFNRGYFATWKLMDKQLILNSVHVGSVGEIAIPANEIYTTTDGIVKALWFSGDLKVGKGKPFMPAGQCCFWQYPQYQIFSITNGNITRVELTENK
jgi:hypothetical protein